MTPPRPLRSTFWANYGMGVFAAIVAAIGFIAYGWHTIDKRHGAVFCLIGIGLLLLTFVFALIYLRVGRRTDKALRAIAAGDFLVHFEYPNEVWQPWVQAPLRRSMKRWKWIIAGGAIVTMILAALTLFSVRLIDSADVHTILLILLCLTMLAELSAIARWVVLVRMQRWYLQDLPATCYISKSAAYLHGRVTLFDSYFQSLHSARVVPGNPSYLALKIITRGSRGMSGERVMRIPIPPGEESVANEAFAAAAQPPVNP